MKSKSMTRRILSRVAPIFTPYDAEEGLDRLREDEAVQNYLTSGQLEPRDLEDALTAAHKVYGNLHVASRFAETADFWSSLAATAMEYLAPGVGHVASGVEEVVEGVAKLPAYAILAAKPETRGYIPLLATKEIAMSVTPFLGDPLEMATQPYIEVADRAIHEGAKALLEDRLRKPVYIVVEANPVE